MTDRIPSVRLQVVDVHGEVFGGRVRFVAVPAEMGEIGILPGHAPLLTTLRPGELRYTLENGQTEVLFLEGGILEIQPFLVTILADETLRVPDIDEQVVKAELRKAEETLQKKRSRMDFAQAERELMREMAKLRAVQNYKTTLRDGKAAGYDWSRPPIMGMPKIDIHTLEE